MGEDFSDRVIYLNAAMAVHLGYNKIFCLRQLFSLLFLTQFHDHSFKQWFEKFVFSHNN